MSVNEVKKVVTLQGDNKQSSSESSHVFIPLPRTTFAHFPNTPFFLLFAQIYLFLSLFKLEATPSS